MIVNDNTGTEDKIFSFHCAQNGAKDGTKSVRRSECNGSEASGGKHPFVE